jgi:hypothetical protein
MPSRWFQSIRVHGHPTRYERECDEFNRRHSSVDSVEFNLKHFPQVKVRMQCQYYDPVRNVVYIGPTWERED